MISAQELANKRLETSSCPIHKMVKDMLMEIGEKLERIPAIDCETPQTIEIQYTLLKDGLAPLDHRACANILEAQLKKKGYETDTNIDTYQCLTVILNILVLILTLLCIFVFRWPLLISVFASIQLAGNLYLQMAIQNTDIVIHITVPVRHHFCKRPPIDNVGARCWRRIQAIKCCSSASYHPLDHEPIHV